MFLDFMQFEKKPLCLSYISVSFAPWDEQSLLMSHAIPWTYVNKKYNHYFLHLLCC